MIFKGFCCCCQVCILVVVVIVYVQDLISDIGCRHTLRHVCFSLSLISCTIVKRVKSQTYTLHKSQESQKSKWSIQTQISFLLLKEKDKLSGIQIIWHSNENGKIILITLSPEKEQRHSDFSKEVARRLQVDSNFVIKMF